MTQPPIPLPVLKDLKCAHCRKFVTSGPVHVVPDSSILCGRCLRYARRSYRNYAFEALASLFYYPCHYWPQHCNKKLIWNESVDHEKNCLYQSPCNVFCSSPGTFFKSERKLPVSGGLNFEHVPEDCLDKLKCLGCESYLSNNPVYIVADGKNVCHRCVHSNGFPKEAIRNLAYETIAQAIIFPCIYRFRGCPIRMRFGRDMWEHEHECPYGQVTKRLSKKPSKNGKERGVIQTHSGHIWGTITPHSALFAPPKTKHDDGKFVTEELTQVIKKKQKVEDDLRTFDSQSMDSVMSKSTYDSLGDNISRTTGDNVSRDNISRDNVSRDNISRDNVSRDNVSRDNISRASSRREDSVLMDQSFLQPRQSKMRRTYDDVGNFLDEIPPLKTPPGYNKVPYNGYYQENMMQYGRPSSLEQYHYLQYPEGSPGLQYSSSFNYPQNVVKRNESFKVGNQEIIDELKEWNKKQVGKKEDNPYQQCNNLQELVQIHDEAFSN